jgi:hypothetical protein
MSFSISLKIDRPVKWPDMCAFCGGTDYRYLRATASYNKKSKANPVGPSLITKGKSTSISYSVCNKHQRLCNLLDAPAEWGFVGSFLMLIFFPLSILLIAFLPMIFFEGVFTEIAFLFFVVLAFLSFISLIALFFFSYAYKPLAIADIKDNHIILELTNESFYKELKRINEIDYITPDVIHL